MNTTESTSANDAPERRPALEAKLAKHLRTAWRCGFAPLIAGVATFVLWLVIRSWLFFLVGYAVLLFGVVSFAVGAVSVARVWRGRAAVHRERWLPLRRRSMLALAVLLSNFPVAMVIMYAAALIETSYVVNIENSSEDALLDVRVVGGGGCDIALGDIPGGTTEREVFWIQNDGELRLKARQGSRELDVVIDGYVTHGWGFRTQVVVDSTGSTRVRKFRREPIFGVTKEFRSNTAESGEGQ